MSAIICQWAASTQLPVNELTAVSSEQYNKDALVNAAVDSSHFYLGRKRHLIHFVRSRSLGWHTDPNIKKNFTILWVIDGEGFAVQGKKEDQPQPCNTIIVLDHLQRHQLLAPKPSHHRVWIAAYITTNRLPAEIESTETWFQPFLFEQQFKD
ncbi:hypothetical protein ACQ4M3_07755 [Leptolyngbya sp. AN03gr2]|uniref:hypothetical protein n=1 Tax=unclassified Leptolyngbya TaxID=2650499 RepID=UPI003D310C88